MTALAVPSAVISRRGSVQPHGTATFTIVWLRGEQDLATLATLSTILARAIAQDDADVVVDLRDVQFMDASTVGAIVAARAQLRSQSRGLMLRAPSASASRVLSLCGLADLTSVELRSCGP